MVHIFLSLNQELSKLNGLHRQHFLYCFEISHVKGQGNDFCGCKTASNSALSCSHHSVSFVPTPSHGTINMTKDPTPPGMTLQTVVEIVA